MNRPNYAQSLTSSENKKPTSDESAERIKRCLEEKGYKPVVKYSVMNNGFYIKLFDNATNKWNTYMTTGIDVVDINTYKTVDGDLGKHLHDCVYPKKAGTRRKSKSRRLRRTRRKY